MVDVILFPSCFFSTKKVDEDLQREYDAVSATGLYDTIFFGYDKWFNEDKLVLSGTPAATRKAIMRGWMMKPSQYKQFYHKLLADNIELITAPSE